MSFIITLLSTDSPFFPINTSSSICLFNLTSGHNTEENVSPSANNH